MPAGHLYSTFQPRSSRPCGRQVIVTVRHNRLAPVPTSPILRADSERRLDIAAFLGSVLAGASAASQAKDLRTPTGFAKVASELN